MSQRQIPMGLTDEGQQIQATPHNTVILQNDTEPDMRTKAPKKTEIKLLSKLITTLYNVCAVPWGCSVLWRVFSTVGGYYEYRGEYLEYRGGYLEYRGVFSAVGDIMSTVGLS